MSALEGGLPPLATTGVGSLPFVDPRRGVRHAVRAYDVPFCPQLPAVDGDMIGEWLGTGPARCAWTDDLRRHRPAAWDAFLEGLPVWGAGPGGLVRMVKLQLTGPVTLALAVERACGDAPGSPGRVALATATARWLASTVGDQIRTLRARGWDTLLVVDEPGLAAAGFAARQPEHAAIWTPLRDAGAAAWGIHVCGRVPWDLVRAVAPDLISFDVVRHPVDHEARAALGALLRRGTRVAWGVIDPADPRGVAPVAALARDCLQAVADRAGGVDAVAAQSLLTPTCGTGRLSAVREHLVAAILGAAAQSARPEVAGVP